MSNRTPISPRSIGDAGLFGRSSRPLDPTPKSLRRKVMSTSSLEPPSGSRASVECPRMNSERSKSAGCRCSASAQPRSPALLRGRALQLVRFVNDALQERHRAGTRWQLLERPHDFCQFLDVDAEGGTLQDVAPGQASLPPCPPARWARLCFPCRAGQASVQEPHVPLLPACLLYTSPSPRD